MTLIIKELIIRGEVVGTTRFRAGSNVLEQEQLSRQLEQIRESVQRDCIELVMRKLERTAHR